MILCIAKNTTGRLAKLIVHRHIHVRNSKIEYSIFYSSIFIVHCNIFITDIIMHINQKLKQMSESLEKTEYSRMADAMDKLEKENQKLRIQLNTARRIIRRNVKLGVIPENIDKKFKKEIDKWN